MFLVPFIESSTNYKCKDFFLIVCLIQDFLIQKQIKIPFLNWLIINYKLSGRITHSFALLDCRSSSFPTHFLRAYYLHNYMHLVQKLACSLKVSAVKVGSKLKAIIYFLTWDIMLITVFSMMIMETFLSVNFHSICVITKLWSIQLGQLFIDQKYRSWLFLI